MLLYLLRRLLWSVLTILGVMVLTFLLFRVIAGDIAAANLGERATARQRADWLHRHGYDKPWLLNLHSRLLLIDRTSTPGGSELQEPFMVRQPEGSEAANALALFAPERGEVRGPSGEPVTRDALIGRAVYRLAPETPLAKLTDGEDLVKGPEDDQRAPAAAPSTRAATQPEPAAEPAVPQPILLLLLADGTKLQVDLAGVETAGDLLERINELPDNGGKVEATFTHWRPAGLFDSQFFHHLWTSATFDAKSLRDNRKLTAIIAEHAPKSLALTVPALALGWVLSLATACVVAYYRGSLIDRAGVFLSVLGMCVPFLAFMIFGQWLMFAIAPQHAYGLSSRANIYVPVAIMVVAGLGGQVRFYRTVILDETNRDYVRTARAKGVPLPTVLFKHILKNCMLPILTNLITAIPFLMMGSLLVESYFGIPGLGDLMLSSIADRNEPILSGMVFLLTLIYTLGVLVTDVSYGLFDPRIRLR